LIVLGFPLGVAISVLPELIIPVAVQVTVLTLLFCSIGIIFKKDLSSWGSILSFGLVGIISMTFTNWQFLHLTFLNTISYYATVLLFLGYLIYDANMAMNSYTEAKELGGLFFVSILLANSLDILQDIIVLFLEILTSDSDDDSDNDSDGGFDSFW
jgi:FtsH-binding integral membrane protein